MVQGFWRIQVPDEEQEVVPEVALAPVEGWDAPGLWGWVLRPHAGRH